MLKLAPNGRFPSKNVDRSCHAGRGILVPGRTLTRQGVRQVLPILLILHRGDHIKGLVELQQQRWLLSANESKSMVEMAQNGWLEANI